MSNPSKSKSLCIKLRDPVEGGEKTFGTVGIEREKLVLSDVEGCTHVGSSKGDGGFRSGSASGVGLNKAGRYKGGSGRARPEVFAEPSFGVELAAGTNDEGNGERRWRVRASGPVSDGLARASHAGEPADWAADVGRGSARPERRARVLSEGELCDAHAPLAGGLCARARASMGRGGIARERASMEGERARGRASSEVPGARGSAFGPIFRHESHDRVGRSKERIDVEDGVSRGSFGRREIIESWSDDVQVRNNINICRTVDEADSSRRRYGRRVVDFWSDSDDSNQAPLASDHAVPSSEVELTDEEEEEDDIPPGEVESIRRLVGAPRNIELLLPQQGDRLYSPPDGFHTVFLAYVTCTSQITPHPTLLKVCEEFNIGYSQLTPTAILMFEAFYHRVSLVGLPVTRIKEFRLCDVEFDPRVLIPKAKKGQHHGGITFAALRAKANGTSKKVPSTLGGSSSGLPREEVHVEAPRVVADDRSSAGEMERRPSTRDRGKGKRVDTEYVAVPKRVLLGCVGHDLPMLSTEGFVREYDRARMSGKGPSHMLELAGGDICRLVATWRYLVEHGRNVEARKEEERVRSQTREDELLSQLEIARSDLAQRTEELAQRTEELAQRREELEVIRGDAKAYKDDVHKLNECYDQLKEKYEVEKATGKRFLATSGGAAYRESIVEETKLSFRGSDECAAMIEEHALAVVYKPLVRACRKYLRDAGGISEKVIRGMEAGISDGEDDEVDVDGTGTELVADIVADDPTVGTSSTRSRGV
ncbi:PREDICTED: uncharacterized protein LOC105956237 [Erythranthe guttata]|uniref:uncharacterized protein LOC105956237 n=1 Tax=Erythranthe guttata TaxID=4155 RepID=UPI00064DC550|nr:PREDICTED: uncharacterized protein LOC105956237 [Erythranthe guttata]|eukprot:XP_012835536.1 PREDICTED: uncharacterized protein LOC105956237 [Erythranthe guttata]